MCCRKSGQSDYPTQAGDGLTRRRWFVQPYVAHRLQQAISAASLLTLCGILVAGLWPFHSPENQVHWLPQENGLHFGHYGVVLSSGTFWSTGLDRSPCTIEIWLKPALTWSSGTVLAFYNPSNHQQLSFRQEYADLAIVREIGSLHDYRKSAQIYANDAFRKGQVFITITSDGHSGEVYVNGAIVKSFQQFGLSTADLAGQLILAASPLQSHSWSGWLRGLAIYGSQLTAEQVAQHYQDWTQRGKPEISEHERSLALYLFNERAGEIAHSESMPGRDLHIPKRYMVMDQILLEPPLSELHRQGSYLKNAALNVAGFAPLGFFFGAYFTSVRRLRHGFMATALFGAIVSLTIEVLQAHLPTRDSGVTDVITNTLGTCIGVALYTGVALPLALKVASNHPNPRSGSQPGEACNKARLAQGY